MNHRLMVEFKQGQLLINKASNFSRFPLGNYKTVGLIAPPTYQLYIPAPPIKKEAIAKKEVQQTEEEKTSLNKKPKIAIPNEQVGEGHKDSLNSFSQEPGPSNIDKDVFEKLMHPVFRTTYFKGRSTKAISSKKHFVNDFKTENKSVKNKLKEGKTKKKSAIKVEGTEKKPSSSSNVWSFY